MSDGSSLPSSQSQPSPRALRALEIIQELDRRRQYQGDPTSWIVDTLGVRRETIDWEKIPAYATHRWDGTPNPIKRILDALAASRWCAVEGATGTEKTFIAACVALWFLKMYEDSLVITTAPKEQQLQLHLWKEIQRLHPRFGCGELIKLVLRMNPPRDDWGAFGFVAGVRAEEVEASATKAQGFHAEHMLIITEETPGIADAVMTAFQNTSISPHNIILALGNPDHQNDTLHRFALQKNVEHIIVSGFDFPNVVLKDPNFIPGGQSEEGLRRLLDRYKTPDNPLYQSRARGRSPQQSREALIRWEWLVAARDREKKKYLDGPKALGVDVANSEDGDKAAIARGQGSVLLEVEDFHCPNANKLGEQVHAEMKSRGVAPEFVGVDGVGVGAGTVNELQRLGAKIVNIISSEKPIDLYKDGRTLAEEFDNLRSQMWWQLRLDLEDAASCVCLPDDEELFADLMTPKWGPRKGKIVVQPKEEMRKKLGRSPNKGDSVVYWNWVRARRTAPAAVAADSDNEEPAIQRRSIQDVINRGIHRRTW